jgi:hypothetical protein
MHLRDRSQQASGYSGPFRISKGNADHCGIRTSLINMHASFYYVAYSTYLHYVAYSIYGKMNGRQGILDFLKINLQQNVSLMFNFLFYLSSLPTD